MHWKAIVFSTSAWMLTGCMSLDDFDYDGYELEPQLCPDGGCSWSLRFGDDQEQLPRAAALNEVGDVFLAGTYNGHFDFGSNGVASPQAFLKSPFLAEFDPTGKARCIHTLDGGVGGEALAVVPVGNKVIWGGFTSDEGTMGSAFVRIDDSCSTAAPMYTELSGTGTGTVNALVVSNDFSTVYVAGTVQGLGKISCVENAPAFDTVVPNLFLAHVDIKTGSCIRARIYGGGTHFAESIYMVKGSSGRLIVAGNYTGTMDGTSLPMEVLSAAFVVSLDEKTGDVVASNGFRALNNTGSEYVRLHAITVVQDKIVVAAENNCQNLVDRNGTPVHSFASSGIDSFLVALDPTSLEKKWSYVLQGDNSQYITGIASPDRQNLFISGMFDATLIFEGHSGDPPNCDAPRCSFLAKLQGTAMTPEYDQFMMYSRGDVIAEARTFVAGNAAGLVWAASASAEVIVDPNMPLPPTQAFGDLDAVVAKFFPLP